MTVYQAGQHRPLEGGPSFSLAHRVARGIWAVTWLLLASWTPRQLHDWRRFMLRAFGARMGHLADVRGSARVWYPKHLTMGDRSMLAAGVICYNMAPIDIGSSTIVSQRAHLCAGTHDSESPGFELQVRPIAIGCNVWIAAEAFVGPGATVGDGAVLGARAVAFGRLEPWTVYVGNPARILRPRKMRSGGGRPPTD